MLKAGALQLPFAPPWSEKASSDIQASSKSKTASTADKVCEYSHHPRKTSISQTLVNMIKTFVLYNFTGVPSPLLLLGVEEIHLVIF